MIFIVFTMLLAFIIQVQIIPVLGIRTDVLLVFTAYYGFLYGRRKGMLLGLFAGLLQDILSGGVFGLSSVGLVSCGMLAGYARRMLLLRYRVVRISLIFILTVMNLAIYLIVSNIFLGEQFFMLFKREWFYISIWNTIISAGMFWAIDRFG